MNEGFTAEMKAPAGIFEGTETKKTTEPKRGRGAPKSNGNATKHRHYSRKVKLKDVCFTDISRQTGLGKLVTQKAEAIYADGGGKEQFSELKQDLVSRYLITELLIQSLDRWLLEQKSLVNKRKRSCYPILAERNRMAETSLKLASALGLERVPAPLRQPCINCGGISQDYICGGCGKHVLQCHCEKQEAARGADSTNEPSRQANARDIQTSQRIQANGGESETGFEGEE